MNEILQKRIEEAARDFNRKEGIPYAIIGHVFNAFMESAAFTLQNQWISVEEALPEETEDGFCDDKFVLYCSEYPATASYNHKSKKWYWGGYEILGVTHWMPIPSLKGGEK